MTSPMKTRRIVLALGGNALSQAGQVGTLEEQYQNSRIAAEVIVREIVVPGHAVVLTHGNGPQVGNILRRVELAREELYLLPLDTCVADSQGGIGYMFQQVFQEALEKVGNKKVPLTLLTRCLVDAGDPAFQNPTKPIGSFMDEKTAKERAGQEGWSVKEDAGRGWRRVVASPKPTKIVEGGAIRKLFEDGEIVVACGGGGIPVLREDGGHLIGVEAVIDKDRASALLALEIGADLLIILTGVPRVVIHFRKPEAKEIARMTRAEAEKYLAEGHFPAGSMGPKIEAAIDYLRGGGREVLITSMDVLPEALRGEAGTWIIGE